MFKTILKNKKPDVGGLRCMAELQRLVSVIAGRDGRNSLDAQALVEIEEVVLNSRQPQLTALYRRLLTDVDLKPENAEKGGALPASWPARIVLERGTALVINCLKCADRITAARRNERNRDRYQPSQ